MTSNAFRRVGAWIAVAIAILIYTLFFYVLIPLQVARMDREMHVTG